MSEAWDEQEAIGWLQLAKGQLSKKWGLAQQEFYKEHPDTRGKLIFSRRVWMANTVISFLNYSLGLWKDRCTILHGIDNKDNKAKEKEKLRETITACYRRQHEVAEDHRDIFSDTVQSLCS